MSKPIINAIKILERVECPEDFEEQMMAALILNGVPYRDTVRLESADVFDTPAHYVEYLRRRFPEVDFTFPAPVEPEDDE